MGLKGLLASKWFTRLVLSSWMACAVSIYISFKYMELIVHGQLYYYGLISSPDWADPYRFYTWLILICLGLPTTLSGIALVSSFFKVEKIREEKSIVPKGLMKPQAVIVRHTPQEVKNETQVVKDLSKIATNGNVNGIQCAYCSKTFSKALVLLDFKNGKNQLISVCPYCNHVLENTSKEKRVSETLHVVASDEKITQ